MLAALDHYHTIHDLYCLQSLKLNL